MCGFGWAVFATRIGSQPSATVRNRSQAFASVRNRSREGGMAVPMVSSAKGVAFGGFQRCVASFRVAGVALWWHSMFHDVSKKSFCGRRNTFCISLRRFQKISWILHGRRNTLETSDVILRGRRSTLDVSCCLFLPFFANRIVSAAQIDKVQILWRAWHFVTRHENRRKPRTRTVDFAVSPFKKTRRKTLILKLRSVKCK